MIKNLIFLAIVYVNNPLQKMHASVFVRLRMMKRLFFDYFSCLVSSFSVLVIPSS